MLVMRVVSSPVTASARGLEAADSEATAARVQNCWPDLDCRIEGSFAWLGRNRRYSKDYEYRVQTSETMLDIAATRLMLNRIRQTNHIFPVTTSI